MTLAEITFVARSYSPQDPTPDKCVVNSYAAKKWLVPAPPTATTGSGIDRPRYQEPAAWEAVFAKAVTSIEQAPHSTISEEIDRVCSDPDSYEEGEPPVSAVAINTLKALLGKAEDVTGRSVPVGDVAPYFGELSITWRHVNRMLRLTSFPDGRDCRLDFGSVPANVLGKYDFDIAATGEKLAGQLSWLETGQLVLSLTA